MANLKVVLEIDNQGYIRGIRAAESATDSFSKSAVDGSAAAGLGFSKLGVTTDKLVIGMTKLKAVLIGGAMTAFARNAIGAADAVADLSKATDLSIGRILELQQALQASGGEGQNAAKLITEFYKSIEEAASGSDKTQETFARLGVSLTDLGKMSTADLLDQTMKGFEKITDPAQKTALAIQLFGKSMVGVSPSELSAKLDELRGKFYEQEQAVARAADLNDRFAEAINNLKLAFLTVAEPIIRFINDISKSKEELATLISVLKALGVVIAAVFGLTLFGRVATIIGSIGRGFAAIPTLIARIGQTGAATFSANGAFMTALRAVAKVLGFVMGGVGAALGLGVMNGEVGSPGDQTAAETARLQRQNAAAAPKPGRAVEAGKELTSQLNAVKGLADGYQRIAKTNMERLITDRDLLGKSEYEIELTKAQGEIEKRYGDQVAALEAKKAGAKGQTLSLINKEIGNLGELKSTELALLEITKSQTFQYKLQQDEIKRFNETALAGAAARASVEEAVAAIILGAGQKMRDEEENRINSRLPALAKRLAEVASEERKIAEAAKQRVAAQFENDPEGLMAAQQAIEAAQKTATERRQKQAEETYAQQRLFVTGWEEAFQAYTENASNAAKQAGDYFNTFSQGFENAIVKFVQTGKLNFKDLANSMIATFARIQAQKMFASLFGGEGGGGILGSIFGSIFKAGGGAVMAGRPYMVGESGQELFVPNSAGRIIPNNQLDGGGGSTNVTYNIQATDAQSFRTMLARDPQFIYNLTEAGRRSQPSRRLS